MLLSAGQLKRRILGMHPAALILAGFLGVIALGTLLLEIPVSTRAGSIPFIDALFTAASAVCVTGLIVVDTGTYYSVFGQVVLLLLIQIGGLGVMTVSVALFRLIGRGVSFRQRMAVQDVFAHTPREDILKLVRNIFIFTAGAEFVGAVLLFVGWRAEFTVAESAYFAVFHAISAFCNAGFSLFRDSFVRFGGDVWINASICGLIVIGGLGFPVLHDVYRYARRKDGKRPRLAVQTKIVLIATTVLIMGGALVIAALERSSGAVQGSVGERILTPIFQSITCRTAGFNTLDIGALGEATLCLMVFLMFVGASPGSTGGGVKTTTLAILSAFTASRIQKRRRVNMFKKSIPDETVTRSAALVLLSVAIVGFVLFLILIGNSASPSAASGLSRPFLAYLFETVSAFGTVGLSMGATSTLSAWGKAWIIVMMIIGRVGVLTFAYVIIGAGPARGVEHAEENVMVG